MLTRPRWRPLDLARRAAEARRRPGLDDAIIFDERPAMTIVRMLRRFGHAQHRREAHVATLHDLAPFVAGLGFEDSRDFLLHRRPRVAIVLAREFFLLQPRQLEQLA